jgi:tetratricopeptide (TPR) repeat protein/tRNA A-37 threonylcarbamoyl transferase component Bud32
VETEPSQSDLPLASTQMNTPRLEVGPEHHLRRLKVEAALFGSSDVSTFGRYRLLDHIGAGGMGSVYAAYDEHLERKIAIKLIRPSRLDSAAVRERTLREARALARLSHPNVVHVYEVGEIQGQLFLAMEFLAGPTLGAWLDVEARRGWRDTLRIFCQAGDGLAAAHAQGIIHRDFKPHNAMFGSDGWVRVLDFGLARFDEPKPPSDTHTTTRPEDSSRDLTISGALMGTPAYMAPEQIATRQVSTHSDQFSFCVALFEALYGYRPFGGETLEALIDQLTAGRVAARPRDTDVPRWLHAVLLRALSVDPEARWPSMHELLAALRRDPRARRRRVAMGALLIATTCALSFAVARPGEPAPDVCAGAGDEAAEIWGETRAADVRELVRGRHGPRADELLAIVSPQLDRYATTWSELRVQACRAHADGQQSSNVFDLRTACLDRRLASLDALVQMLGSANAEQLDGIALAASGLPPLERCADTPALLAELAPPEHAQTRARVQAHRETLARALVHEDAGQPQLGLELVAGVLADAEALAYEPLLAEAWLRKGCLEMGGDVVEAERSLTRALWAAVAIGHAAVAAEASSKRGYLHGPVLGQQQRAFDDLPMLAALNRRVEDDVGLYAEYLNNVGAIHLAAGDWPEARRWFEQARDLRVARAHPMDWRGVATLFNLGGVALFQGRYVDAEAIVRELARESEAVIPSTHDMHLRFAFLRAQALVGAGRPRAAIAEFRPYLDDVATRVGPPHLRAYLFETLGRIEREYGDLSMSRGHLNAAIALTPVDSTSALTLTSEQMLTAAFERDALAVAELYQQLSIAIDDQIPSIRARLLGDYGRALHELGSIREAIAELEKAQSIVVASTNVNERSISADLSYDLGKAYRKLGDHAAAERELLRARDQFSELYPDADGRLHADISLELGNLAIDRERWDEARAYLEQAVSAYLESAEPDFPPLTRARAALDGLDDHAAR